MNVNGGNYKDNEMLQGALEVITCGVRFANFTKTREVVNQAFCRYLASAEGKKLEGAMKVANSIYPGLTDEIIEEAKTASVYINFDEEECKWCVVSTVPIDLYDCDDDALIYACLGIVENMEVVL